LPNRQFYTMKFKSSRLKEFNYNITLNFNEAKELGEIIALADNQMLRSIKKITEHNINLDTLEEWYSFRDKLKKQPKSIENSRKIIEYQQNIDKMMFIPEYLTVVIEHKSHYKYLFNNGLKLNGQIYKRFSCSAGQARASTVVFVNETVFDALQIALNNGRNLNKELTPSKYNAYFGLNGSATKTVSTPKFCVVPDYVSSMIIEVDYVTETDLDSDDKIEKKVIEMDFTRNDGMGLLDISRATMWADELGLDYVPAQWCVRQNFLKGMLQTFGIHDFCDLKNNKNYNIKTSYKDTDDNNIIVNIKDYDVILTESQFKLWDSFDSLEQYESNCIENGLTWGVSLYSPKQPKDILNLNYQFIQSLKLNKQDIKELCTKFVDWINGVNYSDIDYTYLFLLGENHTKETIEKYLKESDNYWVKSLIINPDIKNDKYIRDKIYNLIKTKIKKACLGEIITDGNFQTLVSDPYALMQHVCGLEATGLLNKNEYYSGYWNKKNIKVIDGMRSPLTYRSEHLILNLKENDETNYWYQYAADSGIIMNWFGEETLHFGGADFDFDILATTSNKQVIDGVYKDELAVVYDPPKPSKMIISPQELYNADTFAFGSIIGQITNKSTSAYALLPTFKSESEEYNITLSRLKQCCKAQSAQIDKAKIGREVKGIPKGWIDKNVCKNEILLLDKHPYFFIYLYYETKRKYKNHLESYDLTCKQKFNIGMPELINKKRKTKVEQDYIDLYNKYLPVIDSDCEMNNLCKYIESVNFDLKSKLKIQVDKNFIDSYKSKNQKYDEYTANIILEEYRLIIKEIKEQNDIGLVNSRQDRFSEDLGTEINNIYDNFENRMSKICSNVYELLNYLIEIFYVQKPSSNKEILWKIYGKYIYNNLKLNNENQISFPLPNNSGDIEYLGKKFKREAVKF